MTALPGDNSRADVIDIEHGKLLETGYSRWSRFCPVCPCGTLLCPRSPRTLQLEEYDRCLWCGQKVRYSDIHEMRKRDRG